MVLVVGQDRFDPVSAAEAGLVAMENVRQLGSLSWLGEYDPRRLMALQTVGLEQVGPLRLRVIT